MKLTFLGLIKIFGYDRGLKKVLKIE